jgi:hypothetical protein
VLPEDGNPTVQWSGGKVRKNDDCPSPGTGSVPFHVQNGGIELDHSSWLLSGRQKFHATKKKNFFVGALPGTLTNNLSEYILLFGQFNDKSDLITGVVYGYDSSYGYFAAMKYRWKDHE